MDPALALIALLLVGSFSLLGVYVVDSLGRPSRVVRRRIARDDDPRAPGLALLRVHTSGLPIVERLPLSLEARERMFEELRLAGQPMRVSEYLALRMASALIFGFAGTMVAVWFGGEQVALVGVALVAAIVGWMLPRAWLNRQRKNRQETIERQLGDALMSMAKALRAGAGLLQALAYAAEETPDPLGGELRGVLGELQLGADPDIVFSDLSRRVKSADLDIALTAILIQRSVGGSLAEILSNVTRTIRERAALHREIKVITTRQKLMGNTVAALPILVALLMVVINPSLGERLFTTDAGRVAIAVALGFEALGLFLIRRLAVIDV